MSADGDGEFLIIGNVVPDGNDTFGRDIRQVVASDVCVSLDFVQYCVLVRLYIGGSHHTTLLYWVTLLPTNTTTITPEAIQASFPGGIYIVIVGLPDYPPTTQATRPAENTLKNLIRLLYFIDNTQPTGTGYILANTPSGKLHPDTQEWLPPIVTLDAPPYGSGAHTETSICQNITPNTIIQLKFDHLPIPTLTINERLA